MDDGGDFPLAPRRGETKLTRVSPGTSSFDRLGGAQALRAIIAEFVDRLMHDPMIGFYFQNTSAQRLTDKEYEHAAAALGAPIVYSGRPISSTHRPLKIPGGHFDRRLQILRNLLAERGVPSDIQAQWLTDQQSLRRQVTADPPGECRPGVE